MNIDKEVKLRKDGADAILRAGIAYLQEFKEDSIPAGRFMIYLLWALETSTDGKTFHVSRNPPSGEK